MLKGKMCQKIYYMKFVTNYNRVSEETYIWTLWTFSLVSHNFEEVPGGASRKYLF